MTTRVSIEHGGGNHAIRILLMSGGVEVRRHILFQGQRFDECVHGGMNLVIQEGHSAAAMPQEGTEATDASTVTPPAAPPAAVGAAIIIEATDGAVVSEVAVAAENLGDTASGEDEKFSEPEPGTNEA